jgi:hypothetical protein
MPAGTDGEARGGQRPAEAAFLHPPLPPQERFHDWSKVRAPVRDMERAPSLFERVTQSFARARQERGASVPEREPVMAGGEVEQRRPAAAEEDMYDIPAFLRR